MDLESVKNKLVRISSMIINYRTLPEILYSALAEARLNKNS